MQDDFERVIRINGVRDKISFEELQRLREFLSYRHIFNCDYTWGYTSALLDLIALQAAHVFLKGFEKCLFAGQVNNNVPISWPGGVPYTLWQNNLDRIKELTKAGALIAAEIDRLLAIQKEEEK